MQGTEAKTEPVTTEAVKTEPVKTEEASPQPAKESTTLMFSIITTVLVGIVFALINMSRYVEIVRNWPEYRCDPSISPFAPYYGQDLAETLGFCLGEGVRKHAPAVIDPIYQGINKVTGVIEGVFSTVSVIQTGVSGLLEGLQTFMLNFTNSFRLIGTRVRMIFVGMRDIFARIYGMFMAVVFAGISAITFGENLVCNPLVVFIATISGSPDVCCFAPDTLIRMADGSDLPIRSVSIGDQVAGGTVTSTYLFDGAHTPMVRINGVHVSTNHYVEFGGRMIPAGEHPAAVVAPSLHRIWCLGTDTHRLSVVSAAGPMVVADYEESSDPAVIAEAQAVAEVALTGAAGPTVADYGLGLDPSFQVLMYDMSWKPLSAIKIGDELYSGGTVTGTITEVCESVCRSPKGHYVSAAQLVNVGGWVRAAHIWPAVEGPQTMVHLMVTTNQFTVGGGELFLVRDYEEMVACQAPYARSLSASG